MIPGSKSTAFFLALLLIAAGFPVNAAFTWKLNKDRSVTYSTDGGRAFTLFPKFTVLYRTDDPKLHYENSTGPLKQFADGVNLPCWNGVAGSPMTANYFEAGLNLQALAVSAAAAGDSVTWKFAPQPLFELSASLSFAGTGSEPVIRFVLTAKKEGYFSVGYAGMPELKPALADAIWQPWIWQEKRFPLNSYLSIDEMCPLPSTMVEKDGWTYGLVTDPKEIPFRLPSLAAGTIRFGVLLRNKAGNAQPMVFSPVLGNAESKLQPGAVYAFRVRVLNHHASQLETHRYVAEKIFAFGDYRSNVFNNLNQTVENMVRYGMDDVTSGWNPELKGFDYTADVAQTVKVVSGMHPLAVSFITDDENIYRRRAVPMTEFNLSRERFLFTINKGVNGQNASGKLIGPGVEVAELAALNTFFGGQSPIFRYFADSLKNTERILNLKVKSPGNSWNNLLGLYKMNGDKALLQEVMRKADEYIAQRVNTRQTDFKLTGANADGSLSSELSSQFWTDYSPMWMELLDLYEVTGQQKYLDAAVTGAKLYTEYVWFNPVIPAGSVNVNGQPAEAWRVSQIGMTPEASNTFNWNPAIFLTHFAAHMLRIAHYTNDPYFRNIARSAVIGRYSNFPGYQVYRQYSVNPARPDYPYNLNYHGLFYFNHIWPQIALLYDYLVSDAFAQSKGAISFPNQFVPSYAYLRSKAYGYEPGSFYTDKGVYLWMPAQLLKLSNEQVNYISGYGNNAFYMALTNQSKAEVRTEVAINPTLVMLDRNKNYSVRVWRDNKPAERLTLTNGKVNVVLSPGGITALAVDSLPVNTQFHKKIFGTATQAASAASYKFGDTPFGKLSGAIIGLGGEINTAYIWLNAQSDSFQAVNLSYRVAGDEKWTVTSDSSYPFEFSIPFGKNAIEYKADFLKDKEIVHTTGTFTLRR
ncbi:hypothetical protein [Hufsiella ginkgonis]|uniref:Uncharacterized protein n=1 Tax=Hufsiella ginkgonis TaxID=2695274 RepID=A0A7K1XU08_9SPHI|nr:hypothetical protein [Hufsiella ginkgonis]MXV14501.1 hypothetical protein [Hufsiella ginkgonis]